MPSLKQFHIFFMFIAMALCAFLAYWAFTHNSMKYFYLCIISYFVIAFYGFKFYRQVQRLSL